MFNLPFNECKGHKIVSYKHIRFLCRKKNTCEQKCGTIIILNIKYEILMKYYYDTFIDQNIQKNTDFVSESITNCQN